MLELHRALSMVLTKHELKYRRQLSTRVSFVFSRLEYELWSRVLLSGARRIAPSETPLTSSTLVLRLCVEEETANVLERVLETRGIALWLARKVLQPSHKHTHESRKRASVRQSFIYPSSHTATH